MSKNSHNLSQRDRTILDNSHIVVLHLRDDTIVRYLRDNTIHIVSFITSIREVLKEGQVRAALCLLIALSQLGDKRRHNRVALPLLLMGNGFEVGSHIFLFCLL
jgi:hypothetical protein